MINVMGWEAPINHDGHNTPTERSMIPLQAGAKTLFIAQPQELDEIS
jgi:hypothetical protein